MATISRRWKRILAVGCSHGHLADPKAVSAVLRFKKSYRPDTTVHLGDFTDTAAFRSGAKGTGDEAEPIAPDIDAGLQLLRDLEPTLVYAGNHEARLFKLARHYNAIVAECAQHIVEQINRSVIALKAEFVQYKGIWEWRELGGYKYMHGSFYSENATRDHAEAFGNCVHAHTHRACVSKGRRSDNPSGFGVGTLTSIGNMDYANTRRATLSWSAGFVWGEYCDDASVLWLHEQPRNVTEWRLPSV
jgi:hypothetical protein